MSRYLTNTSLFKKFCFLESVKWPQIMATLGPGERLSSHRRLAGRTIWFRNGNVLLDLQSSIHRSHFFCASSLQCVYACSFSQTFGSVSLIILLLFSLMAETQDEKGFWKLVLSRLRFPNMVTHVTAETCMYTQLVRCGHNLVPRLCHLPAPAWDPGWCGQSPCVEESPWRQGPAFHSTLQIRAWLQTVRQSDRSGISLIGLSWQYETDFFTKTLGFQCW